MYTSPVKSITASTGFGRNLLKYNLFITDNNGNNVKNIMPVLSKTLKKKNHLYYLNSKLTERALSY